MPRKSREQLLERWTDSSGWSEQQSRSIDADNEMVLLVYRHPQGFEDGMCQVVHLRLDAGYATEIISPPNKQILDALRMEVRRQGEDYIVLLKDQYDTKIGEATVSIQRPTAPAATTDGKRGCFTIVAIVIVGVVYAFTRYLWR